MKDRSELDEWFAKVDDMLGPPESEPVKWHSALPGSDSEVPPVTEAMFNDAVLRLLEDEAQ